MNLLYLALLTERVPILPFFTPTHVATGAKGHVGGIDFGEVFDIPRLSREIGKPVLEWWQVKVRFYFILFFEICLTNRLQDRNSTSIDPLGCWNTWQAVQKSNTEPHFSSAPQRLNLGA